MTGYHTPNKITVNVYYFFCVFAKIEFRKYNIIMSEINATSWSNDISGLEDVDKKRENSLVKNWIKLIPKNGTHIQEYNRKEQFKLVANIVIDDSVKKNGNKTRSTVIKFNPTIPKTEFKIKTEWLYIFIINDIIVKIGGTRTGLYNRTSSYLCGHHIKERGKSGDCSKTNGFIYNTFEFYLKLNCKIQMWAYELPITEFIIKICDKDTNVIAQTYHAYESTFLEDYKKSYNEYPILSDNCDPNYKN
jgi:hypothetical protein